MNPKKNNPAPKKLDIKEKSEILLLFLKIAKAIKDLVKDAVS